MKFKCVNCGNVQSGDVSNRFCGVCGDNVFLVEEKVSVVPVETRVVNEQVVVEEPVVVEQPVVVEEPVVVEQPIINKKKVSKKKSKK